MNEELIALCKERETLAIDGANLADLIDELTNKHDPRRWELLPVLAEKYRQIADNQHKIEALFAPEPKKSFLKKLLRK